MEEKKVPEEGNPKAEAKVRPRLFTASDELIDVVVTGFYDRDTGQFEFCVPDEPKEGAEAFLTERHVFRFSRVPYNRLNVYRQQSMKYNTAERASNVDLLKLREYFWMFHLREWNLEDEHGERVPLVVDPDGTLSSESLRKLYELPASLLDTVIALFERRISLA